jgi:hypothetical protein
MEFRAFGLGIRASAVKIGAAESEFNRHLGARGGFTVLLAKILNDPIVILSRLPGLRL